MKVQEAIRPAASLADQLAARLHEQIVDGTFEIGDKLPAEQQIAQTYGVSRPVVREAIGRLKHDGLLVSRQGAGVFVIETSPVASFKLETLDPSDELEIRSIIEILIAIEGVATELAAIRRSDAQLREIERSLAAMQASIDRSEPGVEEDLAFHRSIIDACGNPMFRDLWQLFDARVRRFIATARANSARQSGYVQEVQGEHRRIFEAIEKGDSKAARRAAEQHLTNAAARLKIYVGPA